MAGSTLYLGTVLESLADKLDEHLRLEIAPGADPFIPSTVIVPSAAVRNWPQLFLARRQSVVINLRTQYLENALWETLQALTGLAYDAPIARLEHGQYRLLILAILLDDTNRDPDLAPVREYLRIPGTPYSIPSGTPRDYCRRLWDMADRLARLIRDYEFHRQDELIQKWLRGELALTKANDAAKLERCQRALFRLITDEKAGLRTRLSAAQKKLYKTLPQFANEVMESAPTEKDKWPAYLRQRPVHLFGISQISSHHVRVLRWLGAHVPLRLYHVKDRKSTRLNSSHNSESRMPSSA
jgi:exonuclease V gamma subunit